MMYFNKITEQRCRILGLMLLIATLTLSVIISPALAKCDKDKSDKRDEPVVKVMTYNMDAGTDLLYFFNPALTPIDPNTNEHMDPITATIGELEASNLPGRAELLVKQIAKEKPDLISLQEVTEWVINLDPKNPNSISIDIDQLDLLMDALKALHEKYKVVTVQELTDIPPIYSEGYLGFLDRNVILARSEVDVLGTDSGLYTENIYNTIISIYGSYDAAYPSFGPLLDLLELEQDGWLSVNAKVGGKRFLFFGTHLESAIGSWDVTQEGQGQELIQTIIPSQNPSGLPVILAGDFNSDASGYPYALDKTPTADMIYSAGYDDTWDTLHPKKLGLTWPLFLEDPPIYDDLPTPCERIDLIFEQGLKVQEVEVVGANPTHRGLYPSDHAGVVAILEIEKCKKDHEVDRSGGGDHRK
jgi:hypothetical protein